MVRSKALKYLKSAITFQLGTAAFVGVGVRYFFHYCRDCFIILVAALGTFIVVVIACVALIRQKKNLDK